MKRPETMTGWSGRLLSVSLVLLLAASGCDAPPGPRPGQLTAVEKEYADSLALTYASARSVVMDVDEAIRSNIDSTLSAEQGNSNMMRALEEAHLVLTHFAGALREPTPYTMDSLEQSNESAAKVLESAYVSCLAVVERETGGSAAAWGSNALSDLLGFPGMAGDFKSSPGARARILACIGSEGSKVTKAVDSGLAALHAKVAEIESGRDQTPSKSDCFIATAAYGTNAAIEIDVLRAFRDEVLLQSTAGRDYVDFYYAASPPIAEFIADREWLRTLVRELFIDPLVDIVATIKPLWAGT